MNPGPPTLPDHLRPGLTVVFIGINPGLYSAQRGHYFARRNSRFWPAFSASLLSEPVRRKLGVHLLQPEHDCKLPDFGFGLTDLVKRVSANASQLLPIDFDQGVPLLVRKLQHYSPQVACFHGITGYRQFCSRALNGASTQRPLLGPQPERIGSTRLFVIPNPSPANAHFTLADQTAWYDRVATFIARLSKP